MSLVTILVPSLDRPQYVRRTVENIRAVTPAAHHRILYCVSDRVSASLLQDLGVEYLWDCTCAAAVVQECSCDTRYVTRMNKLVQLADSEFVFFGSDDVVFHENWLEAALPVARQHPVVVVNDGWNPSGTQALVQRSYIDDPGTVVDHPGLAFWPGYHHNYADTEMFAVAESRGDLARAMGSLVEHHHHATGKLPRDRTYAQAEEQFGQDLERHLARVHLWGAEK